MRRRATPFWDRAPSRVDLRANLRNREEQRVRHRVAIARSALNQAAIPGEAVKPLSPRTRSAQLDFFDTLDSQQGRELFEGNHPDDLAIGRD